MVVFMEKVKAVAPNTLVFLNLKLPSSSIQFGPSWQLQLTLELKLFSIESVHV